MPEHHPGNESSVYSHRRDSEWHVASRETIQQLAESRSPWAIPWPCLYEFYAVVTHPKIYDPASTPEEALDQIESWLESPRLVLLAESTGYRNELFDLIRTCRPLGPRIHDGRIAALCLHAGEPASLWPLGSDRGSASGTAETRRIAMR